MIWSSCMLLLSLDFIAKRTHKEKETQKNVRVVYVVFIVGMYVSLSGGMYAFVEKDATRADYIWLYMHSVQCKIPCCLGTLVALR